jgi:hypothetical protein
MAVFELLEQAAYPDLKKFVQIAGGDGQKFHPFKERIAEIPRFFEHAPIKFQPRFFAVEEGGAITQNLPDHIVKIVKVEFLSGCGNIQATYQLRLLIIKRSYQGIKALYQGIALAMPQALRAHIPLQGRASSFDFFSTLSAIREVLWCGV